MMTHSAKPIAELRHLTLLYNYGVMPANTTNPESHSEHDGNKHTS